MATRGILAVYKDLDTTIGAVDDLYEAGITRAEFEVLSNAPFPEGTFGEEHGMHRLGLFPLVGAAIGFSVGLLITGGTQIAYPVVTGGKPILSIPPMIIIMYEGTLLAAVIFTVIGVLFESRLPRLSSKLYSPRITDGSIGILLRIPEERVDHIASILRDAGAEELQIEGRTGEPDIPPQPRRKGAGA
jgi:hypothetical protein